MPSSAAAPQGDPVWRDRPSPHSSTLPRVLTALETCDAPAYAGRRRLVEQTWARRLPANFDFLVATGAEMGVPDSYQSLAIKTRAIVKRALDLNYDWLLIVDDDVYVRADQLRIPAGADYAGLVTTQENEAWCSGAFYWLSANAMRAVVQAPFNPAFPLSAEDRWMGWALQQRGIFPWAYPVAQKPCPCGICEPKEPAKVWVAYVIDPQYNEAEFLEFEKRYAPS